MPASGPASGILKRQLSAPKQTPLTPARKGKRKQGTNPGLSAWKKKSSGRVIHYEMSQGLTPLEFPRRDGSFCRSGGKKKSDVTFVILWTKKPFYCVVSILLCRELWTVVAFTWEMGSVVSPGSSSQLAVSLIQSSPMVLALQYQGCSSRGLLCAARKGVIILKAPNHVEVTGFALLASSYCVDMRCGIEWDCAWVKGKVIALTLWSYWKGM